MSREKKFTPGPWETDNPNSEMVCILNNGVYYYVADCGTNDEMSWAEESANANLIAAAPELLEALEICVELARIKYGNLDTGITKHFDKANSAIKKAYGETE